MSHRREGSFTDVSKLFCAACQTVQSVIDHNPHLTVPIAHLECGHNRLASLPARPGSISYGSLTPLTDEELKALKAPERDQPEAEPSSVIVQAEESASEYLKELEAA